MDSNNPSLPRIVIDLTSPQSPQISCAFSPLTPTTANRPPGQSQMDWHSSNTHPSFHSVLRHLQTPLCPLVSSTTGLQHPDFPKTLLAYHLLTSQQLDDLARHFHQVWPPLPATISYPVMIRAWIGTEDEDMVDLQTKRRRFGHFIGLRGCESPTVTERRGSLSISIQETEKTGEELLEWMQREWEQSLLRAQQDDPDAILRWKAGGC
ncbi:uncharacterized protein ACLA_058110 [Aspergillus clavatus NRRL 1]|uniref:Uncharacterized protein n=1 Tax=Aspergillus clavatus (strain ATCC 1007 / CBS 513.65 / DSM 816 / NCTC 3887 / NRRL 1 / QM 1276 / 107) TaxID=344612 RepID=A1C414_ASPCL|nr:uncharacterized protein ACLA_058110 [Aspergillus clavatus NRRL 1]EAW15154.1 conserved hypothetical protein [Aspergillus clavatus NRRL 1]